MEDFISSSVSTFLKFLSEAETSLKDYKTTGALISFAVQLNGFSLRDKINRLLRSHSQSLYFEHPEENFAFLAFDECISIKENGIDRFIASDKKSREWKEKFINNWDSVPAERIPLFTGGMKFTVEHTDKIWNDFDSSTWFVPENLLLEEAGKNYFIYNFIYYRTADKKNNAEKFDRILGSILQDIQPEEGKNVSIKAIEGNSPKDKKKWKQLISEGIEDILDGKINKVVYSRKIEFDLLGKPDFNIIVEKLKSDYPSCYTFVFRQGKSFFFGATPEKLAKFTKGKIEIDALAGSAPRGDSEEEDNKLADSLLANEKNLKEHNIVIEHIKNSINNYTENFQQEKLTVKKLSNIQHIWTKLSANQKEGKASIFSILNELFPTPAVCGLPKKESMELIKKNEGYHRGMYAGIVGWFNFQDEAEFVVAIRSALTFDNKLFTFAGGGIVADSDPEEEYKETQLKFKPILSLFNNENKN